MIRYTNDVASQPSGRLYGTKFNPGRLYGTSTSSATSPQCVKKGAGHLETRRLQQFPIYKYETYLPVLAITIARASLNITMSGNCTIRPYMDELWTEEKKRLHAFEPIALMEQEAAGRISFDRDTADVITITGHNCADEIVFKAWTSSHPAVWMEQEIEVPSNARRHMVIESIEHRYNFMVSTFQVLDQFLGFQFLGNLVECEESA